MQKTTKQFDIFNLIGTLETKSTRIWNIYNILCNIICYTSDYLKKVHQPMNSSIFEIKPSKQYIAVSPLIIEHWAACILSSVSLPPLKNIQKLKWGNSIIYTIHFKTFFIKNYDFFLFFTKMMRSWRKKSIVSHQIKTMFMPTCTLNIKMKLRKPKNQLNY